MFVSSRNDEIQPYLQQKGNNYLQPQLSTTKGQHYLQPQSVIGGFRNVQFRHFRLYNNNNIIILLPARKATNHVQHHLELKRPHYLQPQSVTKAYHNVLLSYFYLQPQK